MALIQVSRKILSIFSCPKARLHFSKILYKNSLKTFSLTLLTDEPTEHNRLGWANNHQMESICIISKLLIIKYNY